MCKKPLLNFNILVCSITLSSTRNLKMRITRKISVEMGKENTVTGRRSRVVKGIAVESESQHKRSQVRPMAWGIYIINFSFSLVGLVLGAS